MKKIRKIIIAFISTLCLMSSIPSYATANTSEKTLSLDYTDAKELVTSTDDLFSNIGTFMPGDVISDTLKIENKNSNSIELFFKSVPIFQEEYELKEDYELLNRINLKIELNNKNIYDGSLTGTELKNIISLGKFKSKESGEFKFTLTVPTDLKNEFNMTRTKVKWYFALNEDKIPSTPNSEPQNPTESQTAITNSTSDTSPHTGALHLIGIGIFVALVGIGIGNVVERRSKLNEKVKK